MRIASFAERKRPLITGQNRNTHNRAGMFHGGIEQFPGIAIQNPHSSIFGTDNN